MSDGRADKRLGRSGLEASLAVGSVVAHRYELVARLGGGIGSMWKARDSDGRAVALRIETARADSSTRAEPTGAAFARILDAGAIDDARFVATELFDGEDLEERLLQRGAISVDEAAVLLRALAGALGALHARGVVHGGIRPDHIFFARSPSGESVKLLGFGRPPRLLADRVYSSPEQLAPRAPVDARSDIFSTAAVLYRAMTGVAPSLAMTRGAPPRRDARRPVVALPPVFDALFRRALAPSMSERTPSMNSLALAFGEAARQVSGTRPALGRDIDSAKATTPATGAYRPELPTLIAEHGYELVATEATRAAPTTAGPGRLHTLLRGVPKPNASFEEPRPVGPTPSPSPSLPRKAVPPPLPKIAPALPPPLPPARAQVDDDPRLSIAEIDPARLGSLADTSLATIVGSEAHRTAAARPVVPLADANAGGSDGLPSDPSLSIPVHFSEPPVALAEERRLITIPPVALPTERAVAEARQGVDGVAVLIVVATCLAFLGVLAVLLTAH